MTPSGEGLPAPVDATVRQRSHAPCRPAGLDWPHVQGRRDAGLGGDSRASSTESRASCTLKGEQRRARHGGGVCKGLGRPGSRVQGLTQKGWAWAALPLPGHVHPQGAAHRAVSAAHRWAHMCLTGQQRKETGSTTGPRARVVDRKVDRRHGEEPASKPQRQGSVRQLDLDEGEDTQHSHDLIW